jgi:hypothetical protein
MLSSLLRTVHSAVPARQIRSPTASAWPPLLCRQRPVDTLVKYLFVVDDVVQSLALTVQDPVDTDDVPAVRHSPVALYLNFLGA